MSANAFINASNKRCNRRLLKSYCEKEQLIAHLKKKKKCCFVFNYKTHSWESERISY